MSDDAQLLRGYLDHRDEAAFAELVRRYIDLVWGTGYRVTGDADLARDVAQTVFTELAKAAPRFPPQIALGGWLYRTAYHTAAKTVRSNVRRAQRERQIMATYSLHAESPGEEPASESLLPALDEAIARLGPTDREAIVLRFLRRKSLAEVGAALGVSDDAAQKRLARALEKLRKHFRRRGLAVTGSALVAALGSAAGQACPAGLAAAVAASSLAAAGTAGAAAGFVSYAATLQSQLLLMKSKLVIGAIALASVTTPLVIQQYNLSGLRAQNRLLQQQAARLAPLQEASARLQSRQALALELERLRQDHRELLALRDEAARLRAGETQEKTALQLQLKTAQVKADEARARAAEIDYRTTQLRVVDDMKHLGLAARVFANDYEDGRMPQTFLEMTNEMAGMDIDTNRYEFMPQSRPLTNKDSDVILFREKSPRLWPGGNSWSRVYCLADGSVQQRGSATGNFEEYEREHTIRDQPTAR